MDEKKEAELLKQLEEERGQRKELEKQFKELSGSLAGFSEVKEDYAKFKKEHDAKVLANEEAEKKKKAEEEEHEKGTKEYKELFDKYKEKPTWEGASEILRANGGPLGAR